MSSNKLIEYDKRSDQDILILAIGATICGVDFEEYELENSQALGEMKLEKAKEIIERKIAERDCNNKTSWIRSPICSFYK